MIIISSKSICNNTIHNIKFEKKNSEIKKKNWLTSCELVRESDGRFE